MVSTRGNAGGCGGANQTRRDVFLGGGVPQDYVRAHMWTNLGGGSGDAVGVKDRDLIAAMMTPQEIAEAQKMARECKQRNFKYCG